MPDGDPPDPESGDDVSRLAGFEKVLEGALDTSENIRWIFNPMAFAAARLEEDDEDRLKLVKTQMTVMKVKFAMFADKQGVEHVLAFATLGVDVQHRDIIKQAMAAHSDWAFLGAGFVGKRDKYRPHINEDDEDETDEQSEWKARFNSETARGMDETGKTDRPESPDRRKILILKVQRAAREFFEKVEEAA